MQNLNKNIDERTAEDLRDLTEQAIRLFIL